MAQARGVLLMTELPDRASRLVVFTGIDDAKFRRPITPGDQVRIEVDVLTWNRRRGGRMQGRAFVDGKLACEAIISCQLVPRPAPPQPPAPLAPAPEENAELEPVGGK